MKRSPAATAPVVLRDADAVAAVLTETCYSPEETHPVVGKVGLEAEMFVARYVDQRRPPLSELIAALDSAPLQRRRELDRPSWSCYRGQVTEEPGGQLELITNPEPTLHQALHHLDELAAMLEPPLHDAGLATLGTGVDVFHPAEELAVQLHNPRYHAMGEYFSQRGSNGRALMCASASLQVNLDLGPPDVATVRWAVANLASPAIVATFANSPTSEAVNGRALAWMRLDPTRTGIPALLATGVDDPVANLLWAVMRADVMLVARGEEVHAGRPGWSFAEWVEEGHDAFGHPTAADLELHLTTLFPEVRLRGFLEIRGIDQLPRRWRAAPAVLLTALLYDRHTTAEAFELLDPIRRDLPRLQDRAARRGLTDPLVWAVAEPLWELALAGARRLGAHWVGTRWLEATEAYLDRFTRRRHHPADEQRDMRRRGPSTVLEWSR